MKYLLILLLIAIGCDDKKDADNSYLQDTRYFQAASDIYRQIGDSVDQAEITLNEKIIKLDRDSMFYYLGKFEGLYQASKVALKKERK